MMRVHLALVLAAAPLAAQGGCLDQSYLPAVNNGLEITSSQTVTQTFTVGLAGILAGVEIANINHHRGTPLQPLEVRIVAADASGTPSGATLATVTFQPAQVPASRGTLPVDLRAFAIAVTPGTVLGIRLSSTVQPSSQTYAWWGAAPGSYAAGMIFLRDTTPLSVWDLSFQTFVAAPASANGYGAGHPGSNGVPTLTASANPVLGTTIAVQVGSSSASVTSAWLLLGFAPQSVQTPFGGTLLVQALADVALPALPPGGAAVPLTIPNDPQLCGHSVYLQSLQLDPRASHAIAFSPGLELALGS